MRRHPLFSYLLALGAVVVAALVRRFALEPLIGHQLPLVPFLLAIVATSAFGGFGPGLLATALSAAAIAAMAPLPLSPTILIAFVVAGFFISVACEFLHRSRRRATEAFIALEKAQRQLRDSESTFRRLADTLPLLVWMTDASKACIWFNRPWLDFTGRTLEQECGDGRTEGMHPDDRERCRATFHAAFARHEPFEMDYRLRRHDGTYRWLLDSAKPSFAEDGAFLGYMGGCIEIHERKETEENTARALRTEQAARVEAERIGLLKDEFLATVSHELRTPLTAILGWAQLLRNKPAAIDAEQAYETIERNARAQVRIIEDLLDMNRILSGRMRLDVQRVDAMQIVEAAIDAVEPAAAARRIRLLRVLDSPAPTISGDPVRLQQVIWNLLSNAVKFTPPGGKVTLTLERINSRVRITVTDTGEGIAPEFLPHVFDRFRQADASSTRRHQGMGLGLSIVKQLVELHGGAVQAHSHGVGQGASFLVDLPISAVHIPFTPPGAPSVPSEPPSDDLPSPSLSGIDALVVDDDEDARTLLRTILEQNGATVRTAASAAEGFARFEEKPPTVLLSDIGMPGEDGYQFLRRIRSRAGVGPRVPALALTAFARSYDRRRALDAGFQVHLAKPVEPAELISVVASLARR